VFIGNINIEAMRPLVEKYIASIPPKETSFNTFPNLVIDYPSVVDKSVYKGVENKSEVYLTHIMNRKYSFADNMVCDMLSAYVEILFNDVVRQKKSLVYGISSQVALSIQPAGGGDTPLNAALGSSVFFDCDPKNIDEITVTVEAELAKIASGIVDDKMFNDAKSSLNKSMESALESNAYIGSRFANYTVILDIPLSTLYKKGEYYNNVSKEDISAIAREILNRGLVRVSLYPEK
jgi:zinc protease